jgi:hypothetical protein
VAAMLVEPFEDAIGKGVGAGHIRVWNRRGPYRVKLHLPERYCAGMYTFPDCHKVPVN